MTFAMPIWVVYDHPRDHPDKFVARFWLGEVATDKAVLADDLDQLRLYLQRLGLVCLARHPDDDPAILETWL